MKEAFSPIQVAAGNIQLVLLGEVKLPEPKAVDVGSGQTNLAI
jgi:hypothetical protein